jgi:hypothetical protein
METLTAEQEMEARFAACDYLRPLGFRPVGGMVFYKDGIYYDLSAADLTQIDRIVSEGLLITSFPNQGEQSCSTK